ncbi:MAG: glucosaminidase domain-containing protein [Gallionella sp.]
MNKLLLTLFTITFSGMLANAAYAAEDLTKACQGKNYQSSVVPKKMTVQEKKLRFRCLVQPAVIAVFSELTDQYNSVSKAVKQDNESANIKRLKKKYKAKTDEDLLKAMKPHPKSIALAQAAMESAWGTSRFFVQANNIFGVWSFNKNEPRIAAGEKRGKKTIWVKKYSSVKEAIKDYYLVLARGRAFGEFRNLKIKSADPYKLVAKLDKYSERGAEYGKELASMIRYNKFYKVD